MPLYKRHRVLNLCWTVCLGFHNKPKAEVHPGHKLTGPKKKNSVKPGIHLDKIQNSVQFILAENTTSG